MRKGTVFFVFLMALLCGVSQAAVSTEELAARARQGQEMFDACVRDRDAKIASITASGKEREMAVRRVQEEFLKQSREIHLKYREPFVQRIIAEANAGLPEGKRIKRSLGSDIYLRNKVTGKIERDARGRKILNPQHRGMQGDLDIAGDGRAAKRLEETFERYKHIYRPRTGSALPAMTGNVMDGPGHRDFGDVEVTINIAGESDLPGSSAHQTAVRMDAFSKETYVSFGMKGRAGESLVETNDHIKKAIKGFVSPPAELLGARGEKALQGMSKGTLKSIDSGVVSDTQLARVLSDSGFSGEPKQFKEQLDLLKEGHLDQGVGLDKNNVEAFQRACRMTTEQALENARTRFEGEKTALKGRIEDCEARIKSGKVSGDELEEYKKTARALREELMDSKVKVEETTLANKVKLEGGSYADYSRKNAAPVPAGPSAPASTRMEAVKKGLKPGLLDVAGYGVSAFNIYDNISRMRKGEISGNDAVVGITKEVVDTGFSMVTDVGTAAAVGGIGTGTAGAVATVGAPLIIVGGAGYAVSEAVEECLRTFEAYKTEEIAEKVAASKKTETINRLQLEVDESLRAGEATGDWRYFARAEDIADSLERMYRITGDNDFRKNFHDVSDRVMRKKEALESKYACSIYAVQTRMKELRAGEATGTGKEQPVQARPVKMPPFSITGRFDNDRGPALSGPVQNGDVLEFRADVEHPASTAPLPTQLFWQVYDSGNRPMQGLGKPVETYEAGGKKTYSFRFRIDNFENGDYVVALTHRLVSDPNVIAQAVFPFTVFQAVRIDRLLVTDGKDPQTNRTSLFPGQAPRMFVYYTLAGSAGKVRVELEAKENTSGRVLGSAAVERPRDGETPPYRVGLGLAPNALKAGDEVVFQASITSGDGKTHTSRTLFRVIPETYGLKVTAPRMITGGEIAHYSLTPPDGFEAPFAVKSSGTGITITAGADPLRGTLRGSAGSVTKVHTLSFVLRDVKGREASGSAEVTVRGPDPGALSGKGQPAPAHVPPAQTPPQGRPGVAAAAPAGGDDTEYRQKVKGIMDAYTQDKMRIQQQQTTGTTGVKPSTLPKQTTPAWAAGPSGSGKIPAGKIPAAQPGRNKLWRYGPTQKIDCFQKSMACQNRCPRVGQAGADCRQRCDQNVYRPCASAICPHGYTGQGDYINCKVYE